MTPRRRTSDTGAGCIPAGAPPQARIPDEAEYKRRCRRGIRGAGKGRDNLVWTETRNGLPDFKPYVYRGAG